MKKLFYISVLLISTHLFSNTTACDNLYSKVSYALSHTKKAMEATNFEHQMYYAERALKAMEKSEGYMGDCGCVSAEDKSYFAMKSLEKAISPIDWEAGRFYTKKSKGLINDLITVLDECTMGMMADEPIISNVQEIEANGQEHEQSATNNQVETLQLERSINALEEHLQKLQVLLKENQNANLQQKMYAERIKRLLDQNLKAIEANSR